MASGGAVLRGTDMYSDDSSVCLAALHAGALRAHEEGMVRQQLPLPSPGPRRGLCSQLSPQP